MELQPPIFGSNDARQFVAGQVVSLESNLRATLRALAVCAARGIDPHTAAQLVDRAHLLTLQLGAAIEELEDSASLRDARMIATHLEQRLAVLERIVEARQPLCFS